MSAVDLHDQPAIEATRSPIDKASRGCPLALRQLLETSYLTAKGSTGLHALVCYTEALTFSRLVAAQDISRADAVCVVFLLDQIADHLRLLGDVNLSAAFGGQTLALAEMMAQGSDPEMADLVVNCASEFTPAAHVEARRILDAASA